MLVRHMPTSNRVIGVEVWICEGCQETCDGIETQATNNKASRIDNGKNQNTKGNSGCDNYYYGRRSGMILFYMHDRRDATRDAT